MENFEIRQCSVCDHNSFLPLVDLGSQPLCDDLIPIGRPEKCTEYPTRIELCTQCYTAHQAYPLKKEILFPRSYHYRARFTGDVLNGMQDLVQSIKKNYGPIVGKTVLDIGCNDGSLLNFFAKEGCVTSGIEPTDAAADAKQNGHSILQEYFGTPVVDKYLAAHPKPKIISFTNVFAHIEDLNDTLSALKSLMDEDSILVIENHYLLSIFDSSQFDTFYHEHPRTYSQTSFEFIARKLDLNLNALDFPKRYGGNIRVFMSKGGQSIDIRPARENLDKIGSMIAEMNNRLQDWREMVGSQLDELTRESFVFGKSFPGRASILMKLAGIDHNKMIAVYEKPSSKKIGNYVPGTRVPILSDLDLPLHNRSMNVLLLGWHIKDELAEYMKSLKFSGKLYNIMPEIKQIV